jgi:hypothetical protein
MEAGRENGSLAPLILNFGIECGEHIYRIKIQIFFN